MQSTTSRTARRTRSLALRADRTSERRFALALSLLLGLATIGVLATTSALSHHHDRESLSLVAR
jgi:hypothetical protein